MSRAFWVVGCIRSGTTLALQLFRGLVDFADWEKKRLSQNPALLAKHKSFAYKKCENFERTNELIRLFPSSHFFWIVRDGRDVVHSIAFPSQKSIPVRVFPAVKELMRKHKCTPLVAGIRIWMTYMRNQEKMETLDPSRVTKFYYGDLMAKPRDTILSTYGKHFDISPAKLNAMVAFLKRTPNQQAWRRWTPAQKRTFKRFPGANDMLIKHGFVKDANW